MGNCESCNTCYAESEFNDNDDRKAVQKQKIPAYQSKTNSRYTGDLHYKMHLKKVVKLQAFYRGYRQRTLYEITFVANQVASKYFTVEDARETLCANFKPSARPVTKQHTYRSGATYNGLWLGGFRHGKGTMVWPDGAYYDGEWELGQAHGRGTFHHCDGDVYTGDYRYNKACGYGVYQNSNGSKYEGDWREDQQHGKGLEVFADGSRYEGGYAQGKKEGFGTYTWADGSEYVGEWLDNRIHGLGYYTWKDGRKYYGYWDKNDMQGLGIYIWGDGRRYEGQFNKDKKEGYGCYFWSDGRRYEGYWVKGKQHGLGTYIDLKKQKIKYGVWENGQRLQWFDETSIKLINQQKMDYTELFKNPQSANLVAVQATFSKPEDFDATLAKIKHLLKVRMD